MRPCESFGFVFGSASHSAFISGKFRCRCHKKRGRAFYVQIIIQDVPSSIFTDKNCEAARKLYSNRHYSPISNRNQNVGGIFQSQGFGYKRNFEIKILSVPENLKCEKWWQMVLKLLYLLPTFLLFGQYSSFVKLSTGTDLRVLKPIFLWN